MPIDSKEVIPFRTKLERRQGTVIVGIPELKLSGRFEFADTWSTVRCVTPNKRHRGACIIGVEGEAKLAFLNKLSTTRSDGKMVLVMGRPMAVYFHQPTYHWAESVFASWLCDRGVATQDDIISENFHLSSASSSYAKLAGEHSRKGGQQLYAIGTGLVRDRVSNNRFFDGMKRMIELNSEWFSARKDPHNDNVDIFVGATSNLGLYEVKHHDSLLNHQKAILAIAAVVSTELSIRLNAAVIRIVIANDQPELKFCKYHCVSLRE